VPAAPALFFCPLENIFAARAGQLLSRPIAPAFLSGAGHTTNQDPATGTTSEREHDMDATTSPSAAITCAKPSCGAMTTSCAELRG